MASVFDTSTTTAPLTSAGPSTAGDGQLQGTSTPRIRLRPTRQGLFYTFLIAIMLISSLNYQNNLGIITSVFLFICLLLSVRRCRHVLRGLSATISKIEPVFCHTPAQAVITLITPIPFNGADLTLHADSADDKNVHLTSAHEHTFQYPVPTFQRGEHFIKYIVLSTRYPLGVVNASVTISLNQSFIVYPDPALSEQLELQQNTQHQHTLHDINPTDFAGLRSYSPGDPYKLINWKSAAGARGLHVNLFASHNPMSGWIDWDDYQGIDTENRLSLMTRAVLEHEKALSNYGLRLPGLQLRPHGGLTHMKQCLTALACFGNNKTAHS